MSQDELLGVECIMIDPRKRRACLQWVAISGFDLYGPAGNSIRTNLRWFRREERFHEIYTAVMDLFTVPTGTVERWPQMMGALFNQASQGSKASFETWEWPSDLDRRRRAVSVWSSMLALIVAYWTYDSGSLEEMGLFLSEDLKSNADDIRFWCEIGNNVGRVLGSTKEFFVKAVMDPQPSPKTNPILWWLMVTIQSQVLDGEPDSVIGGPDREFALDLTFDDKLKALNHYARLLTLESLLHDWDFAGECFHGLIDKWLVHNCYGPVREILGLLEGVPATRGDERQQDLVLSGTQPPSQPKIDQYQIIVQVWNSYTERQDGHGRPQILDKSSQGVYESAEVANEEARRELTMTFGPRSLAKRWDEHLRGDGTVKIRAVYIDSANNVKVVVWVEKRAASVSASGDD